MVFYTGATDMKMDRYLAKTALGLTEMHTHTVALSHGQRLALVLLDGTRRTDFVLKLLAHLGMNTDDLQTLVDLGLVEERGPPTTSPAEHEAIPVTQFAPAMQPGIATARAR